MVNPLQLTKSIEHFRTHSIVLRRLKRYWKLACGHDRLSSCRRFACFSDNNPYSTKLLNAYIDARNSQGRFVNGI